MKIINGDDCHDYLAPITKQKLAYTPNVNYEEWKGQVKEKLFDLLGMDKIAENACPLKIEIEEDVMMDGYRQIRFIFDSEYSSTVPCYLLIPNTGKEKYPLAVLLQGHTTGFHLSIGKFRDNYDHFFTSGEYPDRNFFGLQAVQNGYAALCIEQRALGERVTRRHGFFGDGACAHIAATALLMGRTVIGERVWDISRAIDVMDNFKMIDTDKILIAGHSGGGTASFYASCYDDRIKVSAVAGAFCSYQHSIINVSHCMCNYIPSVYEWFEMGDLTCLIAPKRFLVFNGVEDPGFPNEGVDAAFNRAKEIFARAGVPNNLRNVKMPCGHEWRANMIWQAINEEFAKLK